MLDVVLKENLKRVGERAIKLTWIGINMITLKLPFATSPHTMANNTGLKINSSAVWNANNRFIANALFLYYYY